MSALPLDRMQRWMQAVVAHPGELEAALASPDAVAEVPRGELGSVILPSRTLAPEERVGIYHGMYLLRMADALEADYPALAHYLGEARFRELVRAYVQAHPSRSYTLNRLGDHLPEFVATAAVPRPAFCADLARLELAVTEVFDAPETPPLSEAAIAAVPAERWERARLEPIAALRLVALRYNASAYVDSVRDDVHDHPRARRQDTFVVVYRRDYGVFRQELSRPAHALLTDLVAGRGLGDAIARTLRRARPRIGEDELSRWFRQWVGGGLFRAVSLDADRESRP